MKVNSFKTRQAIQALNQKIIDPLIQSGIPAFITFKTGVLPGDFRATVEAVEIASKDYATRHPEGVAKFSTALEKFYFGVVKAGVAGKIIEGISSNIGLPPNEVITLGQKAIYFLKNSGMVVKHYRQKAAK